MAWENCVAIIKTDLSPTAKEVAQVDWSQVSENDLNNGFKNGQPFPLICPGRHCTAEAQSPNAHRLCNCKDINGNTIPGCEPHDNLYPYPGSICLDTANPNDSTNWQKSGRNCIALGTTFYPLQCWCCCSCYANGTLISVPLGTKKIEDIQVGDRVMAASIDGDMPLGNLAWDAAKVGFSFGTGDGQQPEMVYIHYGKSGSMICTTDQLFLLADGKVKRGDRLVPGVDQFVSPKGEPVELYEISIGAYRGGVHHIATKRPFDGTLQGHLLGSAGIVTGDFDLQIHADQLKEQYFVENHDKLPIVGSKAYEAAYSHLKKTHTATYDAAPGATPAHPPQFTCHKPKAVAIPDDAALYLSETQAASISDKRLGLTFDKVGLSNKKVDNLLKTFGGHYPSIKFVHLLGHMEVNGFAYSHAGQNFVALSHGLTRLHGMENEGLAMILAHLIERLTKSPPQGEDGWMSVAMSDYSSTTVIQNVYFGLTAGSTVSAGTEQLKDALFDHVAPDDDVYESDPYKPTIATRFEAIEAGNDMAFPPPGIGGPEQGGLKVTGASVMPPQFTPDSFVSASVGEDQAQVSFEMLVEAGVLSEDGHLTEPVTPSTDLSFLFPNVENQNQRAFMLHSVVATLIEGKNRVSVTFNMGLAHRDLFPDDFEFAPKAKADSVMRAPDQDDTVLIDVALSPGSYSITVDSGIMSSNGSTLDKDAASAEFEVNT